MPCAVWHRPGCYERFQQGVTVSPCPGQQGGARHCAPVLPHLNFGELQHRRDTPSPNSHLLGKGEPGRHRKEGVFFIIPIPTRAAEGRGEAPEVPFPELLQGREQTEPPHPNAHPQLPHPEGFPFSVPPPPRTLVPISISVMSPLQSSLLVPLGGWEGGTAAPGSVAGQSWGKVALPWAPRVSPEQGTVLAASGSCAG